MSKPPRSPAARAKPKRPRYTFRLFIAGAGPNSRLAQTNLDALCKSRLAGDCAVQIIDVVKDFHAALKDNILVTPALIMTTPLPRVVILGNLGNLPKVLQALRLTEDAP